MSRVQDLLESIERNGKETSKAIDNLARGLVGSPPTGPGASARPAGGLPELIGLLQGEALDRAQQRAKTKKQEQLNVMSQDADKAAGVLQSLRGASSSVLGGAASGSPFHFAAEVARGLGDLASHLPVVGKMFQELGRMAGAALELPDTLKKFNAELLNANFRFAQFSGAMATVKAQFDIGQMQLDIQRGQALAPSAQRLAHAQLGYQEFLLPMETAFQNFTNNLASRITEAATLFGTAAVEGGKAALSNSKWGALAAVAAQFGLDAATGVGATGKIETFQQELQGLAGNWGTIYGLPNRFGTPPPRFLPPNVAGP